MLMRVLEAGGLPCLTDNIRSADEENPRGYYEYEPVKSLGEGQAGWVAKAEGMALKVVVARLRFLPQSYSYRIILIQRAIQEVLASQKKMLLRRGEPTWKISDKDLAQLYQRHFQQVEAWLKSQPLIDVLPLQYSEVVAEPRSQVARINRFLGGGLKEAEMVKVIEPQLYRNREPAAIPRSAAT